MDTTKQYVKMCEKAPRLLDEWNDGDLYCYAIIGAPECPDKYTDIRMVHHCEGKLKSDAIRIYRQDQLQEMIGSYEEQNALMTGYGYDENEYDEFCGLRCTTYWNKLTSMEQLWLAFAMKERYQKIWNGTDWVKE